MSGIGAVIHNWIPESWIETVLGSSNPFGVIWLLLLVFRCMRIFSAQFLLPKALLQGAQLGTVLSFMMKHHPTLSLPSLIMLRKAVKPKLLALFILASAPSVHHQCRLSVQCVPIHFDLIFRSNETWDCSAEERRTCVLLLRRQLHPFENDGPGGGGQVLRWR